MASAFPWTTPSSIRYGTACARLHIPVLIHTGEPAPFFEPGGREERALARAAGPSRAAAPAVEFPDVRDTDGGARSAVHEAPEHDVHRRALRLPRQRSRTAVGHARSDAERRTRRPVRSSPSSGASRGRRARSSSSIRIAFCSGRTRTRPASTRITGGRSRRPTSTSTTTATTTPSGSCMASTCRTSCCARSITATRSRSCRACRPAIFPP